MENIKNKEVAHANFIAIRLAYNSVEARLKELGANKMDVTNFLNNCIYKKLKSDYNISLWDRKAKFGIESDKLYFFFNTIEELQIFKTLCREKLDQVERDGKLDFKMDKTKEDKAKEDKTNDKKEVVKEDIAIDNTVATSTIKDKLQEKFDLTNQQEAYKFVKYLNKVNKIYTGIDESLKPKFEKDLYKNLVVKSKNKCNVYSRQAQDIDSILEYFENLNDFIINLAARLKVSDNEFIVEAVKTTKDNLKITI